jgi:hypothetical protein
MTKIKLLNDGCYMCVGVKFPIIVDGYVSGTGCYVTGSELIKFGFDCILPTEDYYFSTISGECEIVETKEPERRGCKAYRQCDQMQCGKCGLAWDVDDIDPPQCVWELLK